MTLTVAILGRPNVGKSTLFNRLVGRRLALVDDAPGVTRDRREGEGQFYDLDLRLIDTAGLEEADAESLEGRMRRQSEAALAEADVGLFLIDARAGVTPQDRHLADWLRRCAKPILVVANKCEGSQGDAGLAEAYALGLGDPVAVSAEHGLGLGDLHERLSALLPDGQATDKAEPMPETENATVEDQDTEFEKDRGPLQLAIVGRPNVGKSTLTNRLLGEDRLLTGPEAGITRDSIAVDWEYDGQAMRLIDTAGLRRRSKVAEKVEQLSVDDTLRAIRFAQVVVLVIDAEMPLEKQDLTIARMVVDEGRALVLAVNKWDLCKNRERTMAAIRDRLERSLPQVKGLPVVTLSALQGQNLDRLLAAVLEAYRIWNRRIATAELNRWLAEVTSAHPPPAPQGRRLRLKYMTQAKTRPPSFVLFCSRSSELPASYLRYLENALREDFGLPGTPLRLRAKAGGNPYARKR